MENLQFIEHRTQPFTMTDAHPFGEPGRVNPEGVYACFIHNVGFTLTKKSEAGQNNDRLLVFQLISKEPGYEGVEFERAQIHFPEGQLIAPQGADTKVQRNYEMARNKLFAAFLSVGYTEDQVRAFFANGVALDHATVQNLFINASPSKRHMVIKVRHELDTAGDAKTGYKTSLKLKNGADAHRVVEEYYWMNWNDYSAGKLAAEKPNRTVLSVSQQTVAQERAIGITDGPVAPGAASFQPAVTTVAQPAPGAVMGGMGVPPAQLPATPAAPNPFGGTVSVPPAAGMAPGYQPVPNGTGVPSGMLAPPAAPPSMAAALPPR